MGEYRIPVQGQETTHWSPYTAKLLGEVIESWVALVESGAVAHHLLINGEQPTTEHLRVAKSWDRRLSDVK